MAGSPSSPTILGHRYRLEERIGQGGMSEVWEATDLQLDRRVAVKWLRPNLASDPVVAERFRREAIAVAKLNHPNIVAVHDVFEHGGRQAVVMQLVDGRSLRQLLDTQKRLGPELTIHIGAAVSSALDEAHRAGLVHRDVKPANILLTSDGRVLLADFGIAKGLDTSNDDLTHDNVMMGTAKYLSPEQVRGKRLDGRADLYSLGLVLYECLAGRVPFIGESDADTALARLQRDPTDLNRLRPTLPVGLVDLIHQTLARNPAHRPGTGQELRAALLAVDTTPPPIDPTPAVPSPRSARRAEALPSTPAKNPANPAHPASASGGGRPAVPGEPEIGRGATEITPLVAARPSRPADLTPPSPKTTRQRSGAAAGRPRGRHTPLIVIGLLLAIAAVVAAAVWAGIGTEGSDNLPTAPIENNEVVTEGDASNGIEGEAAGAADGEVLGDPALTLPPPVGNAEIVSVQAWDPDGDASGENDELAGLALPGADPPGGWPTLCYSSQYLGAKRGVGLITSLSQASSGTVSVESFTAPFWIEIFTSDAPTPPTTLEAWGESVTGTVYREQPGTVSSAVPGGTQHALIWLREVGRDPACSSTNPYRGRLGNLTFRP